MVFRLEPGATFAPEASPGGVAFEATEQGTTETFDVGPGCHGPGGLAKLSCSRGDKTFAFDLKVGNGHALGTGAYALEVRRRKATQEELAAIEASEARERRTSRRPGCATSAPRRRSRRSARSAASATTTA